MTKGLDAENPRLAIFDDTNNSGAAHVALSLASEIAAAFGPRNEAPLSIVAYAGDAVAGGLNGSTHWGWCYIRHLWVRADWQRRGLGSRLLAQAETEARARQCAGLYVDTFDAGAAAFYARCGFERFGRIDGFPPGYARVFLHKRLAPDGVVTSITSASATRRHDILMPHRSRNPQRVFMLGATGTIGRAAVRALVESGHDVVCFVRTRAGVSGALTPDDSARLLEGASLRFGDVTDPESLARDGFRGERFGAMVSCLASRTGTPRDSWAIDHGAHAHALAAAQAAGVSHMVLLSAICVQKPLLAFQLAKLAFERALMESGLTYSIVRPTAFFKSLSGQIDRVKQGKSFLLFGNGAMTACKPISDDDLGRYLAECLDDDSRKNRVLPIGGPGDAITPRQQGEHLFALLGREPRFTRVPVVMIDTIIWVLGALGHILPTLAEKAELARIGRYYATESMLVLDPATGRYDAAATPSTGSETLFDFYARLIGGEAAVDRGDHAVF